jgi:hypothetical protein
MKLGELINLLQSKIKEYGNVDCFVNGEYGIDECERMTPDHVSFTSANLLFNTDMTDITDDSNIVCHIGGC